VGVCIVDIIENYFGDGSQSSMEARVYLEDYMERVREFFIIELGGTDKALDDLTYRLALSRANFAPKVAKQRLYQYERNRAIFVEYAINGKSQASLSRKYRLSREQVRVVIFKTLSRLKRAIGRAGLAKLITKDDKTMLALFRVAFSEKEDWSDWLKVREPRDFIYV